MTSLKKLSLSTLAAGLRLRTCNRVVREWPTGSKAACARVQSAKWREIGQGHRCFHYRKALGDGIVDEVLAVLCTSIDPAKGTGTMAEVAGKLEAIETGHCQMGALWAEFWGAVPLAEGLDAHVDCVDQQQQQIIERSNREFEYLLGREMVSMMR